MGFDDGARGRGADDEASVFRTDPDYAGDLLGIDDQVRLQAAGPELHQEIRPSR